MYLEPATGLVDLRRHGSAEPLAQGLGQWLGEPEAALAAHVERTATAAGIWTGGGRPAEIGFASTPHGQSSPRHDSSD